MLFFYLQKKYLKKCFSRVKWEKIYILLNFFIFWKISLFFYLKEGIPKNNYRNEGQIFGVNADVEHPLIFMHSVEKIVHISVHHVCDMTIYEYTHSEFCHHLKKKKNTLRAGLTAPGLIMWWFCALTSRAPMRSGSPYMWTVKLWDVQLYKHHGRIN